MNVKVENLPKSQALVTVEVDAERVAAAREDTFKRVSRDVVIPGFRKGKAPRHLVERYVNASSIQEETETLLVDKVWQELRTDQVKDLAMYDTPMVRATQHNPLVLEYTITLQPTVQIGDFKALRLAPQIVTVSDEDVQTNIDRVREQQASWQPITHRPVRMGDMVTVQAHGNIGDQPIVIPEGYSVVVNETSAFLVPGFVTRMVDMEIGKEQEFAISMPEDASDKSWAGKSGTAFITVQEIKEKVLPELDDAFAKTINAESVADMTEKSRSALKKQRDDQERIRMENLILDTIANISTVSFPDAMIDRQVESMVAERTEMLRQQGIEMDLYLRITKTTLDQMKLELRPAAEKRIRNFLIVEDLFHSEGIVVEDNAVNAEIERIALESSDPAAARKELSKNEVNDQIRNRLYISQLFDRLITQFTEGMEAVPAPEPAALPSVTDSVATVEQAVEAPAAPEDKPKLFTATH